MKTGLIAVLVAGIMAVGIIVFLMACPGFTVRVQVVDPMGLQEGDRLYMNRMAIGTVDDITLTSPREVTITIDIARDYTEFLNRSSVFTIDRESAGGQAMCVLCKNCEDDAPPIETGFVFEGLTGMRYQFACLGKQATRMWGLYLKEILMHSLRKGEEISEEGLEKLKEIEAEHHDEFARMIDDLKAELENLTPEIEAQLDALLNSEPSAD